VLNGRLPNIIRAEMVMSGRLKIYQWMIPAAKLKGSIDVFKGRPAETPHLPAAGRIKRPHLSVDSDDNTRASNVFNGKGERPIAYCLTKRGSHHHDSLNVVQSHTALRRIYSPS
jgi:hypothetical protein